MCLLLVLKVHDVKEESILADQTLLTNLCIQDVFAYYYKTVWCKKSVRKAKLVVVGQPCT